MRRAVERAHRGRAPVRRLILQAANRRAAFRATAASPSMRWLKKRRLPGPPRWARGSPILRPWRRAAIPAETAWPSDPARSRRIHPSSRRGRGRFFTVPVGAVSIKAEGVSAGASAAATSEVSSARAAGALKQTLSAATTQTDANQTDLTCHLMKQPRPTIYSIIGLLCQSAVDLPHCFVGENPSDPGEGPDRAHAAASSTSSPRTSPSTPISFIFR